MSKPKFYQAVLKPINDYELKQITKGQSLTDRMGSEDAKCPECGENSWWLLPKVGVAVREGGKPYCECLKCGYTTHL
jgi:DNA-directed RNA polymerase subunit M/transcription elongation factor TFIIS